jgi:Transposase, Mutator family
MGGESTEAWRALLDDLIQLGLRRPEFLIFDGASGLENAIAAVWDGVPVQCDKSASLPIAVLLARSVVMMGAPRWPANLVIIATDIPQRTHSRRHSASMAYSEVARHSQSGA